MMTGTMAVLMWLMMGLMLIGLTIGGVTGAWRRLARAAPVRRRTPSTSVNTPTQRLPGRRNGRAARPGPARNGQAEPFEGQRVGDDDDG